MRREKGLAKARALFRAGKHAEVIRTLESQIFLHRDDPSFYKLLGLACLATGDAGGALSYLRRSNQLDPHDPECLNALAAVHLRRQEPQESLKLWLRVLDDHPRNVQARRGLDLLKNGSDSEAISSFMKRGGLQGLLPGSPGRPPLKILAIAAAAVGLSAALVLGARVFLDARGAQVSQTPGLRLDIPSASPRIDENSRARYRLTAEEVNRSLKIIEEALLDHDDNRARREINRILLSNAAAAVRDKVAVIRTFLQAPDFTNFRSGFGFEEVTADPALHEGCFVRWTGRIANVKPGPSRIEFDFLAGYVDSRVLAGVVPAWLEFAARIEPSAAYELIGAVAPSEPRFKLRVTSIHQIGP